MTTRFHFKRIGSRLGAGFGVVLGIMVLSSMAAGWQLWRIDRYNQAAARNGENMNLVGHWAGLVRTNLDRAMTATRVDAAAGQDDAVRQRLAGVTSRLIEDMADTAKATEVLQEHLNATSDHAEVAALVAQINKHRTQFVAARGKARDDIQMGESLQSVDAALVPLAQTMMKALDDLGQQMNQIATRNNTELAHIVAQAKLTLTLACTLALLSGIALAWFTSRSITAPMREAVGIAQNIANGDLTEFTQSARPDEIGSLLRRLWQMQQRLHEAFMNISQSVGRIELASVEVATGNTDLSTRTENAASNLAQTAHSIAQLTGNVRQSAESASTANQLANSAAQVAHQGGEAIAKVIATMNDINASSKKISDIISVIDSIAFQTNILALNAAVEAARAGEQGRGFAVVAAEVRSLAQRSAQAAKEIKGLISDSVGKVESGARLVTDAGSTMTDIVNSVKRVTTMIGEISSAAMGQSSGIADVNQSVGTLDEMTQQNAALVEQSAAAAQSLREQAGQLAQVIAVFKLGNSAEGLPLSVARQSSNSSLPHTTSPLGMAVVSYQRP